MKILITNDDSISSKVLLPLATNATFSGYISVSPLTLDRTNMTVFEKLAN